jgi:hypothetical protein
MARPDPKRLEALVAIGALVAPKAKRLAADLALAFHDAAAYIAAHAERMDDRGIDEPSADLPWIALVDALVDAEVLVEIDWKTDAEDVEWAIGKLAKQLRLPPADDPDDDDRSTWELLELAGIALRERDLQLAHLDYGADAYALVVVPRARFAELARLAKQARYGKAEAFGDDLAAAQKDRVARLAKHAREQKLDAAKPRPVLTGYGKGAESWTIVVHALAFDTAYEAPGVKRYVHHYFANTKRCRATARERVARWRADGFVELTPAQVAARPKQGSPDSAYLHIVLPFPERAHYFINEKRIVHCVALRGEAVFETGGLLGKTFGELENWRHSADANAAFEELLAHYESDPKSYVPIDRAALVAKYSTALPRRGARRARAAAGRP